MVDLLAHRGPDEEGFYLSGAVGLAHRRLSIVDQQDGHQPMTNEDRCLWIVFNGEIYNHAVVRPWLQSRGHRYRTRCDTETILHLYEEVGERVVDHLRGMFAFAIWDERNRELFLARDRLGVKPLYYVHHPDGSLYFASEIKALLAAGAVTPSLNREALPEYLASRATSGEATLFRDVKRLLPGHTLRWRDGRIQLREYWDIRFTGDIAPRRCSEREQLEEWNGRFRDAVRSHLMADVPIGVFLSGGIDSSAIAAVMSSFTPEPIRTFSVAFATREANELNYARVVARALRAEHYEVIVDSVDYFAALPRLIWQEDEPLAHVASVPLYFVARLAQQHVKVVLTGEGSDELLAGYSRYRTTLQNLTLACRYERLAPDRLRHLVADWVDSAPPSRARQRLLRTFLVLGSDLESVYLEGCAVFPRRMQLDLFTPQTQAQIGDLDPYRAASSYLAKTDARTPLQRMLYLDLKTYLHELLMKQDQMSMAASIESRVPFLDHELVEFTALMPDHMKLRGRNTKYVLRQSMRSTLPALIRRRPKMGFPVPIGRWLRGPFGWMVDEYVLSPRALARGLFDPYALQRLVQEHRSERVDHSDRLWSLINLEIWQRIFLDGVTVTEIAGEGRGLRVEAQR